MPDYTRKQLDVDGSYIFPYTHADAVLYTTANAFDGITSGTATNVKAVLDALDNTYRRQDSNITSLYNSQGKRGFLYQNGTTTTASMELPTQGNDFYVPTLKYDSSGNITTAWQTPASIAAAADLSGYLPLTGGTLTGLLTIDSNTMGAVPHIQFNRANFNYLNVPTNGTLAVSINGAGGANTYLAVDSTAVYPGYHDKTIDLGTSTYPWQYLYTKAIRFSSSEIATAASGSRLSVGAYNQSVAAGFNVGDLLVSSAWSDYTNVPTNGIYSKGNIRTAGNIQVGTGGTNSYLASDSATNIYLHNSQGAILVCDGLAVRRGTTLTNATLGTSTYPWLALYATTVYENGTSLASKYLSVDSTKNISINGTNYALYTSASSLPTIIAPTAYASTGGYILATNADKNRLEWVAKPTSNISTSAVLSTSNTGTSQITATQSDPYYNLIEGSTVARSIQFKAGTGMTVSTTTAGVITFTNSLATKNITVNESTYALYTSAGSLPTIYAPTALADTGGYILATNSGKTGVEWVVKPTSNITTSAVISSSATGTAQITAAQTNPYYNLIEGSTVARSIRFVAGTGISISAATDGQITITNTGGGGSSATVSSILASTSTGTSAISGDTLDPYYNLLVNSAVSSSVQFKAGTNMAITAGTDNSVTFANTLTNMAQLTNNLFINGTQTATTGSWKGKLPAEITSLYNGLTIFYRLPQAGSGNASLQLYAPDGTTTIGANCPVYGGNTRLTTHYPQYSIIPMTYYNGEWRANPYYNTNSNVTQTNSTASEYRAILMGSQSNASVGSVPTGAVTAGTYKSSNFVYSPSGGRLYIRTSSTSGQHGYYVASTVSDAGYAVGLVMMSDLISRGVRDTYNGKWLWYMDDTTGDTVKTEATVQINSGVLKLSANCQMAYDSTNQCINFTFM